MNRKQEDFRAGEVTETGRNIKPSDFIDILSQEVYFVFEYTDKINESLITLGKVIRR